MTKSQAGQMGGLATYRKYGKIHMSNIGKMGAKKTWSLYRLSPIGTANFAIVNRETNVIIGYMSQWRM